MSLAIVFSGGSGTSKRHFPSLPVAGRNAPKPAAIVPVSFSLFNRVSTSQFLRFIPKERSSDLFQKRGTADLFQEKLEINTHAMTKRTSNSSAAPRYSPSL